MGSLKKYSVVTREFLLRKKNRYLFLRRIYIALDILFLLNHNIHKSSCGHCFWAPDPFNDGFYQNLSILKGLENKGHATWSFMNVGIWWKIISSHGVEIYFVNSISLTEWGLPTEISSSFLHTYDHLTRCRAIDPDSIRFCDFHNSMIDFSSDDLIFFFNTQIPFICRNEQFAQFKKVFST